MNTAFRFAHLSDPHFTEPRFDDWREIANKRALSVLSWKLRRRHRYKAEVFHSLAQDALRNAGFLAITGDLTQAGLKSECQQAADWLAGFEGARHLCLIPGNHDSIRVRDTNAYWQALWRDWMAGAESFPYLLKKGPVAFIGLSSAVPTPPFVAGGRLGTAQLAALPALLRECRETGLCRILLVHHCPAASVDSPRRGLFDAAELRDIIAREGVELVLHGHNHRWLHHSIRGPCGDVPVLSPPSAASLGTPEGKYRAGYYLFQVSLLDQAWQIRAEARELAGSTSRSLGEKVFELANAGARP